MKITTSRLRTLLTIGENLNIEFKRASDGPKADTFESVCAFLNTAGGDLLLGVEDDGEVIGLPPKTIDAMIRNFVNVMNNPDLFEPVFTLYPNEVVYRGKHLIHVRVPESADVHRFRGKCYQRVHDADVRVRGTEPIAQMFIRKQRIFTEQKVYPFVTKKDLRLDLIPRIKNMVSEENPWKDMSADQILKSARLLGVDASTGKRGFKAAAILLLGSDDVIGDIFPAYKTDALLQKVNVDRYDDRDVVQTNLIESYDRLQAFGIKHLMDKFFLEDDLRVSLRGKILREMLVNVLVHREFTSSRPARFIIRRDEMFTDNANKALHYGVITPRNLEPEPKNPIIANFFHQIQLADELGSGVRNLYKYVRIYSGALPIFDEGDIFRLTVPLNAEHSPEAVTPQKSSIADREKGGMKTVVKTREKTREKGAVKTREKTREKIIRLLKEMPNATQDDIVGATALSVKGVEWNLKVLKESGRIRRVGPDKGGHWEVIDKE